MLGWGRAGFAAGTLARKWGDGGGSCGPGSICYERVVGGGLRLVCGAFVFIGVAVPLLLSVTCNRRRPRLLFIPFISIFCLYMVCLLTFSNQNKIHLKPK